jgi:hypothetical protein
MKKLLVKPIDSSSTLKSNSHQFVRSIERTEFHDSHFGLFHTNECPPDLLSIFTSKYFFQKN